MNNNDIIIYQEGTRCEWETISMQYYSHPNDKPMQIGGNSGCGFENGISGEPRKKTIRRYNKKFNKRRTK